MAMFRIIAIGAVLALLGYTGANALDAALADPPRLLRMIDTASLIFVNIPGGIAVFLLLFGGMPLAVFGLLRDRHWAGARLKRQPHLRVPYAVLMFQLISILLSALWLLVMGPDLLWALSNGIVHWLEIFLCAQIVTGIAAVPVWRRKVMNTSVLYPGVLFPTDSPVLASVHRQAHAGNPAGPC